MIQNKWKQYKIIKKYYLKILYFLLLKTKNIKQLFFSLYIFSYFFILKKRKLFLKIVIKYVLKFC